MLFVFVAYLFSSAVTDTLFNLYYTSICSMLIHFKEYLYLVLTAVPCYFFYYPTSSVNTLSIRYHFGMWNLLDLCVLLVDCWTKCTLPICQYHLHSIHNFNEDHLLDSLLWLFRSTINIQFDRLVCNYKLSVLNCSLSSISLFNSPFFAHLTINVGK